LDLAVAISKFVLKPSLDRFIKLAIYAQVILRRNTILCVVSIFISNAMSEILRAGIMPIP
jgi:hypothetical protein